MTHHDSSAASCSDCGTVVSWFPVQNVVVSRLPVQNVVVSWLPDHGQTIVRHDGIDVITHPHPVGSPLGQIPKSCDTPSTASCASTATTAATDLIFAQTSHADVVQTVSSTCCKGGVYDKRHLSCGPIMSVQCPASHVKHKHTPSARSRSSRRSSVVGKRLHVRMYAHAWSEMGCENKSAESIEAHTTQKRTMSLRWHRAKGRAACSHTCWCRLTDVRQRCEQRDAHT
jgi:hypothetical protein